MTQFVEFVFSVGGVICAIAVALLWLRLKRSTAARRCLIVVIVGYMVAAIYPVSHHAGALLARGFRPFKIADLPPGRTALVLLGSSAYSAHDWEENTFTITDRSGSERVVEAARIYRLIKPEWVISSGGRVYADDRNATSAEAMREMLIKLGVPDSQILVSTAARTTHEEAVRVRGLLKSIPADRVVLVTSDLHMRRSLGSFRAEGIAAIPAITRHPQSRTPWNLEWLPSEVGLAETRSVAHEFLGICYYAVRGWYRFE